MISDSGFVPDGDDDEGDPNLHEPRTSNLLAGSRCIRCGGIR